MTDTIVNSVISGAVSAILLATPLWIASRRKTKDKLEEMAAKKQQWARDDEVARRVAEAADQAAKAAVLLVESNTKVAANAKEVNGKLDSLGEQSKTIHDLVNSKMTEQMQDSLESKKREVVALKELISFKQASNPPIQPSEEALGVIKSTEEQIGELQAMLNDRKKQQEAINANKLTVTMTLPK